MIGVSISVIAFSMFLGQQVFADNPVSSFILTVNENVEIFLLDRHRQLSHNMTHHPAMDIEPVLASDAGYLAFQSARDGTAIGAESDIYIIDLHTGKTRQLMARIGNDSFPQWSPDGRYLAFRSEGYSGRWPTILVADVQTGEITRLFETVRGENPFAWSPDGSRLAFVTYRDKTEVHIVTFPGRKRSKLIGDSEHNYLYPHWTTNSTLLVGVDDKNKPRIEVAVQ